MSLIPYSSVVITRTTRFLHQKSHILPTNIRTLSLFYVNPATNGTELADGISVIHVKIPVVGSCNKTN